MFQIHPYYYAHVLALIGVNRFIQLRAGQVQTAGSEHQWYDRLITISEAYDSDGELAINGAIVLLYLLTLQLFRKQNRHVASSCDLQLGEQFQAK